jgi:hypothetical protein
MKKNAKKTETKKVPEKMNAQAVAAGAVTEDELKAAMALPEGSGPTEAGQKIVEEVRQQAAETSTEPQPEVKVEPKLGDKVQCVGAGCGRQFALAAKTLVVADADELMVVCYHCRDCATAAGVRLATFDRWQAEQDEKAAKKVVKDAAFEKAKERMRAFHPSKGGDKKALHECLLEMDGDKLEKAFVVSLKKVPEGGRNLGIIVKNTFDLAALRAVHSDSHNFWADKASELLQRWEAEERREKANQNHFAQLAAAQRAKFAAKGDRRRERADATAASFRALAGKGKSSTSPVGKPERGDINDHPDVIEGKRLAEKYTHQPELKVSLGDKLAAAMDLPGTDSEAAVN